MKKRPLLLDLFCCAGGAAKGYHNAGFDIVGVDKNPQPHYPFPIIVGDALGVLVTMSQGRRVLASNGKRYRLTDFSAVHGSPPCQRYSGITPEANRENHPDLLAPTRELFKSLGLLYVIENVPRSPMVDFFVLCGTMFGLQTLCGARLERHRWFETNFDVGLIPPCDHRRGRTLAVTGTGSPVSGARTITVTGSGMGAMERPGRTISVTGHSCTAGWGKARTITVTGNTAQQNVKRNEIRETYSVKDAQAAMGIDWMPMRKLSQAIPPAYTEFIGIQLMREVLERRANPSPTGRLALTHAEIK